MLKQLQCAGERALRQRTLWKRGLFYAFIDMKLCCLKCQYFHEQSFFKLLKSSRKAPTWCILHTNGRLDHKDTAVFRSWFHCIFWSILPGQRGRKTLSSSSAGRLSPTCSPWKRRMGWGQCFALLFFFCSLIFHFHLLFFLCQIPVSPTPP